MNDPTPGSGPKCVRFGDFEADLRTEELFNSGRRLRLPHQSFRVLAMLLERAGQLVTREELCARLWPAGTLVEYDQGLNTAINRLREALGDSAEAPRFIETLPKRGYRFIAAIEPPSRPAQTTPRSGEMLETAPCPEAHMLGSDEPVASLSQSAGIADQAQTSGKTRPRRRAMVAAAVGLASLLIAITIWTIYRSPALPQFGRQVIPLASLPGKEVAPTFSPDGSQIAFAWNESGADYQFDLYVKSLVSARLLRLTHHASRWISPAWSPDGSAIAFVRQTEEGAGLFVIAALGGSERSIVSSGLVVGGVIQISWAPDGNRIAYTAYGPTGVPQVYIVSPQTLNTKPLSPAPECLAADEPAFSPDGKQLALACTSSSAVYAIYLVGLPDGRVRRLTSILGIPQGLAWAADGSRLILSNDPGGGGQLWQLFLNGRLEQLPFGEDASSPVVAARGGRMAYVRGRSTVDIWRADLTAPHPEESAVKLIYSTRIQIVPRYSRDGAHILFQSNRSGSVEIWMTDAQGADLERLTSFNGAFTSAPSWCSDGRRIAFDSRVSGISAIYLEDINERVPRKLVTSQANLLRPTWSEDCRWLFASDGNSVLYRVPSSGGQAERFADYASSYSMVVADRMVFNVMEEKGVMLSSKPVAGGPQAPLEGMPKLSYGDSWAATVDGIYYADSLSRPISLNFYDFASRTTRKLMTLTQAPIPEGGPGIAVSPDGRWLLYGQSGNEHSEITLAPYQ